MRDDGCAAMLHDLLRMDLGDWQPRMIVETAGLADQKQQSLEPEISWLQDILVAGQLPGDYDPGTMEQEGCGRSPCEVLFASYVKHAGRRSRSPKADQTRLGIILRKYGAVKE